MKEIILDHNTVINNKEALKEYLLCQSKLPGTRENLEAIERFSKSVSLASKTPELFLLLTELWHTSSDGNDPSTILVSCGLMGVSHYYFDNEYHDPVKKILIVAMNDSRWRIREIIQEALKVIAHKDYQVLQTFINEINNPTLLEWRAIITTLAHPEILKTSTQKDYAFSVLELTLRNFLDVESQYDNKDDEFVALIKGLNFAPSVIIAAVPERGFELLGTLINSSSKLNKIIKENLKKNRLLKKHSAECQALIEIIDTDKR